MLIKKKFFVKLWLKCTNFNHSKIRCDFRDPLGPTSEIKTRSLVEIILFIALEKVKYNRLYLIKLLPKQLFLHM